MDIARKIQGKLERILKRLKVLKVIQTFKLEISFCQIEENIKANLVEIDSVLRKCLKKIITKPRKAEIRNIITEIVRKKNLNNFLTDSQDLVRKKISLECIESQKNISIKDYLPGKEGEAVKIIFNCDVCKEEFESERELVIHKESHQNIRKYICDTCGEFFSDVLTLKSHSKKHAEELNLECEHCSKSFKTFKKLRAHIKNHEEKLVKEKDEVAEPDLKSQNIFENEKTKGQFDLFLKKKESVQSDKLIQDEIPKKKITKEVSLICKCGKAFRLLKTLKKHQSLKHSSKNIQHDCAICSKSFVERGKLNRHMLSHKGGQHECSFCFKQFARSDALKRHTLIAHNSKKEFSCSFCQKSFSLKYNRDVHEDNIHKNVNNWLQCEQCGQKFRNKITLKSHLKIHSDKRIVCSMCNKSFARKIHYKNHMKSKHFGVSPFQTLLDSVTAEVASRD